MTADITLYSLITLFINQIKVFISDYDIFNLITALKLVKFIDTQKVKNIVYLLVSLLYNLLDYMAKFSPFVSKLKLHGKVKWQICN